VTRRRTGQIDKFPQPVQKPEESFLLWNSAKRYNKLMSHAAVLDEQATTKSCLDQGEDLTGIIKPEWRIVRVKNANITQRIFLKIFQRYYTIIYGILTLEMS
jgi:hypothetical protein